VRPSSSSAGCRQETRPRRPLGRSRARPSRGARYRPAGRRTRAWLRLLGAAKVVGGENGLPCVRYDTIGPGYADYRRADPRIAAAVHDALGDARTVVNVGAGTGSYEPTDRPVIPIEPSTAMALQRHPRLPPAVLGVAESLPLADGTVDAAMAVLSLHHWTDPERGLAELTRVARRRTVLLTIDPEVEAQMWLFQHYVPEILEQDRRDFPAVEHLGGLLKAPTQVITVRSPPTAPTASAWRSGAAPRPSWTRAREPPRAASRAWTRTGRRQPSRALPTTLDGMEVTPSESVEPVMSPAQVCFRDALPDPAQRQGFECVCCGRFTVMAVAGLFANPRVGSPTRFCGPACRSAAWRRRRANVAENTDRLYHGGSRRRLAGRLLPEGEPGAPEGG